MRLTTRTNLAMRTLMYCAVNNDRIVRKSEVAEACNASENHLAQVVNSLAQLGFIRTLRGRNGGLTLERNARHINVGDVFRALEAGLPFAECFAGKANTCPIAHTCRLREALLAALEAFYSSLDDVSLEDLVSGNDGLRRVLEQPGIAPMPCGAKPAPQEMHLV